MWPKKSCSSQQTMDAYVRVTNNVSMDTSANVSAMTLNSLTKDLVTCVNCKREWDGYAQCPCWYDNYDGENQENELHCEEELSDSAPESEEEECVYVPKDRNIVKKKANPLDVIYSVFKNYGIVNEETYKYSLGRDKEVQNVTGKYAYQLQKLKHLCFDGLLSERNAILFTDRVKASEVALNEMTDELQKYVLSTAWVYFELFQKIASRNNYKSYHKLFADIFNVMQIKYSKRNGVILVGPPDTGKSAIIKLLQSLYERYEVGLFRTTDRTGSFWFDGLPGKLLYIGEEISLNDITVEHCKLLLEGSPNCMTEVKQQKSKVF